MMLFVPLEQFEIRLILSLTTLDIFDISITVMSLYLIIISFVIFFFFFLAVDSALIIPIRWQSISELLFKTLYNVIIQQTGSRGNVFFPLFFFTFLFILAANTIGLIGYSFTPTSHIAITLMLALSFNLSFIIIGIRDHVGKFFLLFVPQGISYVMLPLLISIEVLSYLLRTLSLSVRLFANMMAGHTLLYIFASFVLMLLKKVFIIKFFAFIPFVLLLAIFILEIGIALLQSYVFVLLLSIYIHDSFEPQH